MIESKFCFFKISLEQILGDTIEFHKPMFDISSETFDTVCIHGKGGQRFGEAQRVHPPDAALETLARRLYSAMVAYFKSDQGKREFAEWQAKRDAKSTGKEVVPEETLRLAA